MGRQQRHVGFVPVPGAGPQMAVLHGEADVRPHGVHVPDTGPRWLCSAKVLMQIAVSVA